MKSALGRLKSAYSYCHTLGEPRLLPQPGGFGGFIPREVGLQSHQPSIPDRPCLEYPQLGLYAAGPSRRIELQRHEKAFSTVDDLLSFPVNLLKGLVNLGEPGSDAVVSVEILGIRKESRYRYPLDLRIAEVDHGLETSPIQRL